MGVHIHGSGEIDVSVGEKKPEPRDNIHETGFDLNLNEDPNEDWGETVPEDE